MRWGRGWISGLEKIAQMVLREDHVPQQRQNRKRNRGGWENQAPDCDSGFREAAGWGVWNGGSHGLLHLPSGLQGGRAADERCEGRDAGIGKFSRPPQALSTT